MPSEPVEKPRRPSVEIAAGGIVWNRRGPARRLAIIHRAFHKDWSLPKGKLEWDETPEEAAVREVKEEIGVTAQLGKIAGTTWYLKNGRPKLVLYWHMLKTGESPFQPNEEVAELRWVKPAEALRLLTYDTERDLLRQAIS